MTLLKLEKREFVRDNAWNDNVPYFWVKKVENYQMVALFEIFINFATDCCIAYRTLLFINFCCNLMVSLIREISNHELV